MGEGLTMNRTFIRRLAVIGLVTGFCLSNAYADANGNGNGGSSGGSSNGGSNGGSSGGSSGGGNGNANGNGNGNGNGNPAPVPPSPVVSCQMVESPQIDILKYMDAKDLPEGAASSTRFPDMALLKVYCYSNMDKYVDDQGAEKSIRIGSSFQTSLPSCAGGASGLCVAGQLTTAKTLNTSRQEIASILIRNMGKDSAKLTPGKIQYQGSKAGSNDPDFDSASTSKNITLSSTKTIESTSASAVCRVVVSGALDPIPDNVEIPEVNVSNGILKFKALVTGATGLNSQVETTTWSGGPDLYGVWETPTMGKTTQVTAKVRTYGGQDLSCSIKVRPMGQSYAVKLQRYGDCSFFSALRSYYYMDATGSKLQGQGYSTPLRFAGLNGVQYGKNASDIPFRGVLNGASSIQGVTVVGLNGLVTLPPLSQRLYSKAIIVARPFNSKDRTVGDQPVAWGILDYSNYSLTRLEVLNDQVKDTDEVVFQVYLAHKQMAGDVDIRGTSDSKASPYYSFVAGTTEQMPLDRIVPFVNDSCALMVVSVPTRADKALPAELGSAKLCSFSKPYSFGNFKQGRVALSLLHMVPEHGTQSFPSDLMKASHQPSCVATNPSNTTACWNISAAAMGQNTNSDPFTDHTSCRTVTTTTVNQTGQICGAYGCVNYTYPTTVTTVNYAASCNVVETSGECGRNMAIRFSGYNQMMLAALGCAAKNDKPGEAVTATLRGEGIMPYTSFGGSAPKHHSSYPAGKMYGANTGYACIPCRFASEAAARGLDLGADTAPLPVDQDSTAARKPIYSFTKSMAPVECVRNIEFEVRYFGSSACDGVHDTAGNFCTSGNIGVQNCSTSDVYNGNVGSFGGGGNIAGKFKIPICPGSGFEYDNISVSWSPIIVDVTGNGIGISRDFGLSVLFDIKGNGRPVKVDWPMNTNEVAFLVRPDKNGKVTSIRQLFGDFNAKNGFEALRKLDTNRDGQVDRKDKDFGSLALWFDRNRNGVVDPGEIETLEAWGVASLPLNYAKPVTKGIEGKTLSTAYFNERRQKFLNVEDHYFYEYQQSGKKVSKKTK